MMADADPKFASPYERIGQRPVIAAMVERFYDLMEGDPAYAELRAMHAPDLKPMSASLTDFLMAWMGGPRDWFEARPGACMMSAHSKLGVTRQTAEQWVDAMRRAALDTVEDTVFVDAMMDAFSNMAMGMARTG
jgi:hemoglobin